MSRISIIDYEAMIVQIKKIREHGEQLNREIIEVYSNLESMHKFWYGKRYNTVLTKFNKVIPQLNIMLELVVGKLPYTLELIANNYSLADSRQNVTLANEEKPSKINELAITKDVGMRFLSEKVIDIQQEISKCFERVKDQMNQIEIEYSKILWKSESSKMFEQTFNKLKNEIIVFFENIDVELKKIIAQAENDMETAEKFNNVGQT